MANIFNDDFRDFIASLNTNKVEYVLVGGYSVILHGYNRTTGDMDVWVNKSEENYNRLTKAFADFWMPMFEMTKDAFLNDHAMDVFTFGRQPSSLNIMTRVKGLDFNYASQRAGVYKEDDLEIRFINFDDLTQAKKAAGRHKDLNDIENLTDK